jgi:pimeloyl-ACP methyl ester carboxylesterase
MVRLSAFAAPLLTVSASPLTTRMPAPHTNTSMVYTFNNVPITKDLQYIPCFENFTCTNIKVPLDYDNTNAGSTNIAFIKHTARKQPAKGDIIYNPGGPGGSAAGFFVGAGFPTLTNLLGDEWNLVGMDPRGVNNSGPNLDCFKGKPELRNFYDTKYAQAVDARSEASLRSYFADAGAFGDWCSSSLLDDARYANTPATARDMLQYAELLAESEGKPKEEAKVNYFGVSYGSALGNTFAQLYPDRVGRFVIDGNLDGDDYYRGSWGESLRQSDEAVHNFIDKCLEAGPNCAFFRNDSSSTSMGDRLDALLIDIEKAPIVVTNTSLVQFPTVVNHMDLRGAILLAMYDSIGLWPILATILSDLEHRDGSILAAASGKGIFNPPVPEEYSTVQPKLIIACNDNRGRYNVSTFEKLQDLYADNLSRSKYLGEIWAQIIVPQCRNLKFQPPANQQFHGELPCLETQKILSPTDILQNSRR